MAPRPDAKCAGCDEPYRRVTRMVGRIPVVVKTRLKLCIVAGERALLCDKCRKLNRESRGVS